MEFETSTSSHQPTIPQRLLSAVVPVLFIATSYVDPGKWAAAVEGGSRFGLDYMFLVLIFNFAAILCQYMSARIAAVTGRDLAQICGKEYDNITCIFLGAQAVVSMIVLDLTMVLGTAHGLTILFGIDLFTAVFLTAVNAVLFPFLAMFLENGQVKFLSVCLSLFVSLSYVFGVFICQPGNSLAFGGTLTSLSGESVFVLMSLLGANMMPHNFYLHSFVVQQDQGTRDVSRGALCHDHLFAIVCIFSGIFMVNFVLMNSAASVFHSTGLVLLTFQDAFSLMDQVFMGSIAPMALILLMFFSNQVTALSWTLGGQVVVRDLFKMDIPWWLHHATIRIIAIIPALFCVWSSGAEGIYQMMIFTQVVVALMLPSSVIPLFRVAASRSTMGAYRISQFEEFLALITFVGMLVLKILFFIELIFGNSDWLSNLRWNTGSSIPIAYVAIVFAAFVSFCLMLWLAATPLKSATSRIDAHVLELGIQTPVPDSFLERDVGVSSYPIDELIEKQEQPSLSLAKSMVIFPELSGSRPNLNLSETLHDSENVLDLACIDQKKSETSFLRSPVSHQEASATEGDTNSDTTNRGEVSDSELQDAHAVRTESMDVVEKTLRMDGDSPGAKDDGEFWEPEEPMKGVSENNLSMILEGPGSLRSLSGKSNDAGSGTGSLSRLQGLGRAARRQLTVILDEFWGQLFDLHGQSVSDARYKKWDFILGLDFKEDSKSLPASVKLESTRKEFLGYFPPVGGASESLITSSLCNLPKQQMRQSMYEPSYGVQGVSSSMWSPHMQLLDAYSQNSSRNNVESGERRYSSMRIPSSSDGYDQQPNTVLGYELAYLSQIAKDRGSCLLNSQIESLAPKSTSSLRSYYGDSFSRPLGTKPQNGLSMRAPPGFDHVSISKNSSLASDRPAYDVSPPKLAENVNSSVNFNKKYSSLPNINGMLIPCQDSSLSEMSGHHNNSVAYRQSVGYRTYGRTFSSVSSRAETPLGFDALSLSRVCRDAFPFQINSNANPGSLWSRQPFEQFGVAETHNAEGEQLKSSNTRETMSLVDSEAKLLQPFRYCIMKLLKLEGSDWLFGHHDGADEDLIDRIAARERFLYEAETVQISQPANISESGFYDRKTGSALKIDEADYTKFLVASVPHCGEGCVYKGDLVISFGVWCIHRILDLSLMESRPELWGKYTYVLNRLQGIIELGFFKPRSPTTPCFCLQLPVGWQQKSSTPMSNWSLPPHAKQGRGKCTTAATLLDIVKDVEMAISCRKGRSGTTAGDVAFPKGKENLASVLKRYKRRLSNKQTGSQESGSISRKVSSSIHHAL